MYGILAAYLALVAGHTILISREFLNDGIVSGWFAVSSIAVVGLAWLGCKAVDRLDK